MEHEHQDRGRRINGHASNGRTRAGAGDSPANGEQYQSSNPAEGQAGELLAPQSFEHDFEGQKVQTVVKDGQTWWVASHVCAVLEIANPRDALVHLDDDEKGVAITDTLGGPQEANVVNESGLYHLIFRSRKPQAKTFRRWVTSEVLPSIRKTGRYEVPGRAEARIGEGGCFQVTLPGPGRYVVTLPPGRPLHIHETEYDAVFLAHHPAHALAGPRTSGGLRSQQAPGRHSGGRTPGGPISLHPLRPLAHRAGERETQC